MSHSIFLKSLGMVKKSSKTEIVIFNKQKTCMREEFQIDQSRVINCKKNSKH